uniref:DUF4219 domain-containing protein n=1 Tax=Oryza sativa subsp. japonica TaxID=39947 RepID=Q69SZ3_ORYSJ|nr:hypothetical protein [Oryza sativa Japonica Group]
MASRDIVHTVGDPPMFDGTNYAQWKIHMFSYFKAMSPKIWWIVDVGFSHALDDRAPTSGQEKCLHLDAQATNALFCALSDDMFNEVCNLKSAHAMWVKLKEKYEVPTLVENGCTQEWMSGEDSISSSDDEELPTPSTSPHCLMTNGKNEVKNDSLDSIIENTCVVDDDGDDDEPSYDDLFDMLREASKYIAKEKKKNQILEKTLLSLKDSNMELINSYKELCDSYKTIKEAYESLLIGNAFSKPKVDIGITCNLIDDDMPCVASSCSTSKPALAGAVVVPPSAGLAPRTAPEEAKVVPRRRRRTPLRPTPIATEGWQHLLPQGLEENSKQMHQRGLKSEE